VVLPSLSRLCATTVSPERTYAKAHRDRSDVCAPLSPWSSKICSHPAARRASSCRSRTWSPPSSADGLTVGGAPTLRMQVPDQER